MNPAHYPIFAKFERVPFEYACDFPDCGKSFTRKDHLSRHAANHTDTTFTCHTCHRGFKRLDLLHRHEKRKICGDDSNGHLKRQRSSDSEDLASPTSKISDSPRLGGSNHSSSKMDPSPFSPSAGLPSATPDTNSFAFQSIPADFEVSSSQEWTMSTWQQDSWDTTFYDTLAPPFNEPVLPIGIQWGIAPRVQESAERGQESLATPALVGKIQDVLPELGITLPFLIESLASYWSSVAPTFPFIHRGSFDLDIAPIELVAMIAIVGAVQQPSPARSDFRKAVQKIRGTLVQACGYEMPITTIQTFCLCHVHDTWFGTAETQFIAQCMWPIMVAHSRKKGIGVAGRPDLEAEAEEAWATWAKEEERRRAAFCVLLIDTQLSGFWNQHPSRQLSIFAHNIAMPCPRNQWEAQSAADWYRVRDPPVPSPTASRVTKSRPGYLPGLHPEFQVLSVSDGYSSSILSALAAEERLPFRVDLEGAFGVEVVLLGLMGIAWDCRTRGGMGIRFREGTKHWRSVVLSAVINLRAAWEVNVARLPPSIEVRNLRDTFAIGIVTVLSDIPMLQVAAGATTICGAAIGPKQYKDAQRRLRMWGKTEDAWTCFWQSARYLRQALFADWGIYSSWAVFLTTLVHWAYSWTLQKDPDRPTPLQDAQSMINPALSHSRSILLLETVLASPNRLENLDHNCGILDLVWVVCEKLDVSGDVEKENGAMLGRLLGVSLKRGTNGI